MADEPATNLGSEGDTFVQDTASETQEVETEGQEPELDENGDPITAAEDEEIELDDLKLKVPKDQAQKVREALLRQADYTRKTQELAEARKAVQAERETVQQASQAEVAAHAQVVAIDQQLAAFQNVDWDAWEEQDPFAAQKGLRQLHQLEAARNHAAQQFVELRQQRTDQMQQISAKRLQESAAALADPKTGIKGWSPDYAAKLLDAGVREYGFERSEIEAFEDHRMVRVLDDAAKWRAHEKSQKKAQGHIAAQAVKPAAKVGGGSSPPAGLDDRLSIDEWQKRRNEQVRKRA